MKITKKLIYINLGLHLTFILLIFVSSNEDQDKIFKRLIGMALLLFLQISINLILGIIFYFKGKKEEGKAFLLSAGIVLLVGFSSCIASVNL